MYYGRILRGVSNAALFSLALVFLWTGGSLIENWMSLFTTVPMWKVIAGLAAIFFSYLFSLFGKSTYGRKSFRSPGSRGRIKEHHSENSSAGAAA